MHTSCCGCTIARSVAVFLHGFSLVGKFRTEPKHQVLFKRNTSTQRWLWVIRTLQWASFLLRLRPWNFIATLKSLRRSSPNTHTEKEWSQTWVWWVCQQETAFSIRVVHFFFPFAPGRKCTYGECVPQKILSTEETIMPWQRVSCPGEVCFPVPTCVPHMAEL